jgi:NAD(P)-dependent dehydrogenase (short-subunit alcohol dehydrogenase family)
MAEDAAIVIGAKGGIGAALVSALNERGSFGSVLSFSRSSVPPLDICDETSVMSAAAQLAEAGIAPRLIIVATGLLHKDGKGPEKSLRELDPEWMAENFRVNTIGPALIAKHLLSLMPRDGRTCFAVLSARVGSISDNQLGGWHSYRASKAALNMLIRNISIEWQRKNPEAIVVGLHPGTVETPLSAPFKGNPATERFAPALAAKQLLDVLEKLDPDQSGQLFTYDGKPIAP